MTISNILSSKQLGDIVTTLVQNGIQFNAVYIDEGNAMGTWTITLTGGF
jgi:hypothetical protein